MNDHSAIPVETRSSRSARLSNHVHRYLHQMRRHWWIIPVTVILALGIQAYLIHKTPQSYISTGKMIVGIKIQTATGSTTYIEELSNFLGTQVALMQSSTVLNRATDRLLAISTNTTPSPVRIRITVSPKTTIFQFEATGLNPDYTLAYLDSCMAEYMELKKTMRTRTSDLTLDSIREELNRLEGELKAGESNLLAFQSSNSVVFLEEQGNSAGSYLAKLNRQLADAQLEAQLLKNLTLDQNIERQQKKAAGNGVETDNETAMTKLVGADSDYLKVRQEIQLLKAEEKELSEFLRPKHPKRVDLSDRIQQKEKLLEILRSQSQEQLANRRSSIDLQIASLKNEIKDWETRSIEVSRKMAEYQRLKSTNARFQSLYDRLLATMQSLGVDKDINPESVTILEKATVAEPANIDAVKKMILSGMAGLAAGLILLFLIDRFDDRANSFTDLQEMFDEQVLCQIPRERLADRTGKIGLLQPDDKRHAFREAFRNLRSSLLYMSSEGQHPRTLLVTSAVPNEGKSVTAANLAITLAQAGGRVVLIDADLRKGVQHERFGLESTPGLCEALNGQVDWKTALRPTPEPNLSLLARGRTSSNPSELFLNPVTQNLLKQAAAEFDWVVIDSAPVMAADDVATLAPRAEGVIFVLRANHTSARVGRAALDLLYQRNVRIFGLAFNAVRTDTSDYYYYKYKSYYAAEDGDKESRKS